MYVPASNDDTQTGTIWHDVRTDCKFLLHPLLSAEPDLNAATNGT